MENENSETETPIEAKEITLTFTVGQINQLLTLLGELPFYKSADAITAIKAKGDEQLAKLLNEKSN